MEVKVVAPLPTVNFNFDSSCSSPYIIAPSSPQPFSTNLLFSIAPTSPSHDSSSYSELNDVSHVPGSSSPVTSKWEPKQSTPKRKDFTGRAVDKEDQSNDDDFEFNFIGHLEKTSLSADELFVDGKIKPLKPPPVFESTSENRREPPQQQRGIERKSGFSFSSSYSSSSNYNYNYIHNKSRSLWRCSATALFVIPLAFLGNCIIRELLKMSEEEFGLKSDGPITLSCDSVVMNDIVSLLK